MDDKDVSGFWFILLIPAIIISYIVRFLKKDHMLFITMSALLLVATGIGFYLRTN